MSTSQLDRKRLYYVGNLSNFTIGLVAALYPEEKTHRLNILHAWWPAGIVVGGLMGFAGGMAIQFVLPQMGAIFDSAKAEAAGGVDKLASLSPEAMDEVLRYASVQSFQAVAYLPLLLLVVFGAIWIFDRKNKG